MSNSEDYIRDGIIQYFYDIYMDRSGTYRGRERGDIAANEIAKRIKCGRKEVSRNLEYLVKSDLIEHIFEEGQSRDPNFKIKIHTYAITSKGVDLKQGASKYMSNKVKKIKVGKNAVVIGDVSGEIGDGSVVIGATDERGNTILNESMAIGKGAKASQGSIAIGSGASAGTDLFHLIDALKSESEIQGDDTLVSNIEAFRAELNKPAPEQETVNKLWSIIQVSATTGGALGLVQQIGNILGL